MAFSLVRQAIHDIDPHVPVLETVRMSDVVSASLARRRFTARVFAVAAASALGLAAVGLYALLACSVATRRREIGIRAALGAQPSDVRRLVTREGLQLASAGLLVGIAAASMGGRLLETLLFGVAARDPGVLAVTALIVMLIAAAACVVPASRAARMDPSTVLRQE